MSLSAAAAKSLQSCPTLWDRINGSPPGFPVPGILQARTLEWVSISFSNAWTWKVKGKSLSHAQLLATPWTAAYQAPSSMGFSPRVLEWVAIAFSARLCWSRLNTSDSFNYPSSQQGDTGFFFLPPSNRSTNGVKEAKLDHIMFLWQKLYFQISCCVVRVMK